MEIQAACKVVWREDAFCGDKGTIRTTAHGNGFGLNLQFLECIENVVDGLVIVIGNRIGNIAIGIFHFAGDGSPRFHLLQLFYVGSNTPFLFFVFFFAVVADIEADNGFGLVRFYGLAPDVPFFSFCAFRRFAAVEHVDEIAGQERRVDQIALGAHGMGADTVNGNCGRTGVECFVDDFPEGTAVYGVGKIDGEFGKVHILRAEETTFFVGDKGDVDIGPMSSLSTN